MVVSLLSSALGLVVLVQQIPPRLRRSRATIPNDSRLPLTWKCDDNLAMYKAQLMEGREVAVNRLTNKRDQSKEKKIHLQAWPLLPSSA